MFWIPGTRGQGVGQLMDCRDGKSECNFFPAVLIFWILHIDSQQIHSNINLALQYGCGPSSHHTDSILQHPRTSYRAQLYGFQTNINPEQQGVIKGLFFRCKNRQNFVIIHLVPALIKVHSTVNWSSNNPNPRYIFKLHIYHAAFLHTAPFASSYLL